MKSRSLIWLLRSLKSLGRNERGNVLLLTAMGLPIMLGGAGFGVDTAQWYLWKRELQTAVDAAALSGAYTYSQKTSYDYQASARRELARNVDVATVTAGPVVRGTWGPGSHDAITVSATAQRVLPFSALLGVSAPVLRAQATAAIIPDGIHCMVSLDKEAEAAIDVNGNAYLGLGCGMSSNSRDPKAVMLRGGRVLASPISSVGGIEAADGVLEPGTTLRRYSAGQKDPFAGVTYTVPAGTQEVPFVRPQGKAKNEPTNFEAGIHRGNVSLVDNIHFGPGVHIFDGGTVTINANAIVTGENILIVLKNGAKLELNGGAEISLSAATSAVNNIPSNLVGVLIFEDASTAGSTMQTSFINGTADINLGGAIYMPTQQFKFTGNGSPNTECLLFVARRIVVTGSARIENECDGTPPYSVDTSVEVVRLVE